MEYTPIALIVVALIQSITLIYMRKMERNTNSLQDRMEKLTRAEGVAQGEAKATQKELDNRG